MISIFYPRKPKIIKHFKCIVCSEEVVSIIQYPISKKMAIRIVILLCTKCTGSV